ncbi:MAG TPA: hypothetical protein VHM90_13235 [Phycisphaerae bacterium]|nr:hypothetical protein [Phycisphaerae bacterium]
MMRIHFLAVSAVLIVSSLVLAQATDMGGAKGAVANPAPATGPARAGEAASSASEEERSRWLLELKAQRAAIAGRSADDPRLSEIDGKILALQQRIVAPHYLFANDPPPAERIIYPRIVQPMPDLPASQDSADSTALVGSSAADESASDQAARRALEQSVTLMSDGKPLAAAFDALAAQTRANLYVNWAALQAAGIDKNTPVTLMLSSVTASRALRATVEQAGGAANNLAYTIDDGVITVSTREDLSSAKYQQVRSYNVRDLVMPGSQYPAEIAHAMARDRTEALENVIRNLVRPDSWRDNGGNIGSIQEFDGLLIVNQTAENHAAVQALLTQIRAAR